MACHSLRVCSKVRRCALLFGFPRRIANSGLKTNDQNRHTDFSVPQGHFSTNFSRALAHSGLLTINVRRRSLPSRNCIPNTSEWPSRQRTSCLGFFPAPETPVSCREKRSEE